MDYRYELKLCDNYLKTGEKWEALGGPPALGGFILTHIGGQNRRILEELIRLNTVVESLQGAAK